MYNKVMSLSEIDDLIPFERKIYLDLWNAQTEERNKELEKQRKGLM